jgi:hypothetical protein
MKSYVVKEDLKLSNEEIQMFINTNDENILEQIRNIIYALAEINFMKNEDK